MAKKKEVHVNRAQLSMLLPIYSTSKSLSAHSYGRDSHTGSFVNVSDSREAAIRNLEKSGLRYPKK